MNSNKMGCLVSWLKNKKQKINTKIELEILIKSLEFATEKLYIKSKEEKKKNNDEKVTKILIYRRYYLKHLESALTMQKLTKFSGSSIY